MDGLPWYQYRRLVLGYHESSNALLSILLYHLFSNTTVALALHPYLVAVVCIIVYLRIRRKSDLVVVAQVLQSSSSVWASVKVLARHALL